MAKFSFNWSTYWPELRGHCSNYFKAFPQNGVSAPTKSFQSLISQQCSKTQYFHEIVLSKEQKYKLLDFLPNHSN